MGTTANLALPYPDGANPGNVPFYTQQLADAVDTQLAPLVDLPYVEYRLNAGQTIANNLETTIDFDANPVKVRGTWVESAGVITFDEAGYYTITVAHTWAANTTGTRYFLVTRNGTTARLMTWSMDANKGDTFVQEKTTYFAAGDTIRLRVYQNSGGNLIVGEMGTPKEPMLLIRKVGNR